MRARTWLAAIAAVGIAVGCSATVPGHAVKAPTRAGGNDVDVALLDHGNFPTKPRPPLGVAGDAVAGAWQEARRMADYVVGPWEADPGLAHFFQFQTGVVRDASVVSNLLALPIGEGVDGHNFVTGFSSTRGTDTGPHKGMTNVVLRFASPDDAAAAAADMDNKGSAIRATSLQPPMPTTPIAIPRYPGTSARAHEWTHHDIDSDTEELRHGVIAITAHGPYVLCQYASAAESADVAAQLIANTLDLQGPLIEQFQPTPVDQLPQLPLDPDGLVAHTMPPGDNATINDGVYNPRGAVHLQTIDPIRAQALFKSARLQQLSYSVITSVYQTGDAQAAARVVDELAASVVNDKWLKATGVKGMPGAKCFTPPKSPTTLQAFYCVTVADRYAIQVQDQHEAGAHQLIAAQYLMLTGK